MAPVLTVTMNPAVDISALADRVEPERKIRCRDPKRDAGGGGVNVARVLRRFGTQCCALYPAGGSPGALLHGLLDKEGIESVPVGIAGDTRENFTVFAAESREQYRFVLPGPELAPEEWQACLDRIASLPAPSYVVASGALPPGAPPDLYRRIVRTAADRGARVVVDTSGDALESALGEGVHLVKPNLRELSDLTGRPLEREADWEAAAADLVASGAAEIVAVSLGHRGAMLVSCDCRLHAPAVAVKLVSAVGAGDSFVAGMVWQLHAGSDLRQAFAYGVAAGTAALLTPGTELCRPKDVERIHRQVRVHEFGASSATGSHPGSR